MKRVIYPTIFVISLMSHVRMSQAEPPAPRSSGSAKECAICHYRWIDTFYVEGRGSDLVEYQAEKVVATREMCFSCHDGSVVDSRARVYNDLGHKINQPPPSYVKVPEMFPLDEEGNVACATCHTAHGVPSGKGTEETIFMRTSNKDSRMCNMCHPGMEGGLNSGSHTVGVVEQDIPQRLITRGAVKGSRNKQIICETCHTAHGSPYECLLIESGMDSGLCLECHGDKDVIGPDGKRRPFHVINVKPQNARIPEGLVKKGARLGRNGMIICQTCHKVHGNKIEQQLLLIKKDKKSTLCKTCHLDKEYLAGSKHDPTLSMPKQKNLQGNTAAETGICSACHLPHKAATRLPGRKDFTTQLCLSCHGKGGISEKQNLVGSTHPLGVNPLKETDADSICTNVGPEEGKLTLPLFNKLGVRDKEGKMTCLTCHDPHRWSSRSQRGEVTLDVEGTRTTFFLRKESPEICGECHSKNFSIANSAHDLSKVAPKEKNILGETFSESGLCGTCHLVHNARDGPLWAREIDTKADNIAEELCTSCHHEDGIGKEKLIRDYSHPVNISPIERGLTTTLPLFDRSGTQRRDGVISCATCHDPHCPDPSKSVVGNNANMGNEPKNRFLRLTDSPSPKLCENCHTSQAYVEKTDHDLVVSAPSSRNVVGQTPLQSGPCGVCHLVHNSKSEIRLWAQGFAGGQDIIEMMCNSCHSERGWASKKKVHHLEATLITMGYSSCGTCHNPHQWDPEVKEKGKGLDIEGDGTNSFLRARSYDLPCSDCHGRNALESVIWPGR